MKYYQHFLSSLASSVNELEKSNSRQSCRKPLERSFKNSECLTDENKGCALSYLSGGKEVIRCKKLRLNENLAATPEGEFFAKCNFFSLLKMGLKTMKNTKK